MDREQETINAMISALAEAVVSDDILGPVTALDVMRPPLEAHLSLDDTPSATFVMAVAVLTQLAGEIRQIIMRRTRELPARILITLSDNPDGLTMSELRAAFGADASDGKFSGTVARMVKEGRIAFEGGVRFRRYRVAI